jgi:predicted nucleic acid-binding protein
VEFLEEFRLHHVVPTPVDTSSLTFIRDADDRPIVAVAISAGATVLVTEDRDILDIRDKLSDLSVLTPREFWQSLREG